MDAQFVRLISARREDLWQGEGTPPEDFESLRERHGEKIAAVHPESPGLLGWATVYPERDSGGPYLRLADIQVLPEHRGTGIGASLMDQTREYMEEHRLMRLKFSTSPLLTWNAGLFMKHCGMRYLWKEGMKTPGGKPWPYVSCEWELDDRLEKPPGVPENVQARSVIDWEGPVPAARKGVTYSGPLYVPLPDLSGDDLLGIVRNSPETLVVLYRAFHDMHLHGYRFAWFDALPGTEVRCRRFYLMEKLFSL